jgi:hypothetical protein
VIGENSNQSEATQKVVYKQYYLGRINDVYIFKIVSDSILRNESHEDIEGMGLLNHFSGGLSTDNTVNVLFIDKHGINRRLFKKDHLIKDYTLANSHDTRPKEIYDSNSQFKLDKNIYLAMEDDSNQDGFLSKQDHKNLYLSDYNGDDTKLLMKNVENYSLVNNNQLLIVKYRKKIKEFYLYDIINLELKLLNNSLDLSEGFL